VLTEREKNLATMLKTILSSVRRAVTNKRRVSYNLAVGGGNKKKKWSCSVPPLGRDYRGDK